MNETAKLRDFRKANGVFDDILKGNGIDIGCGPDLLVIESGTIMPWDKEQGDAQVLATVPDNSLDFAYSSHCLEHMRDVPESLKNWARVVRPGGYIYVAVPDYFFYEKGMWPSHFNMDHKHSWSETITRAQVGRSNHWNLALDLFPLAKELGLEVVKFKTIIANADYNNFVQDFTLGSGVCQIDVVFRKPALA